MTTLMAAAAGTLPVRYARPARIATGGMGEIYLAEDTTLGRRVAIKLLSDLFARDEAVRARFTREALAAARLSGHPHIVTIFDVGEADGRPFIVMEYLAGGTVADWARRGPVRREVAMRWLAQAAEALDDAHREGIIHRDVKPANLLLDERGELHVADFGIARVLDETPGMTLTGTVLGTAGYLSPEQARGDPATAASDVYGLGVVAYELLTGGRPFEGGSATAEAAAHIHQPVPPASERGVGLPVEVDAVFDRVLAKEPGNRYRSARDFVRALSLALGSPEATRTIAAGGTRAASRAVAAPTPGRRGRSWLPILAALGLAAAAIAGLAVAISLAGEDAREAQPRTRPTPSVVTETRNTTVFQTTTAPAPPPSPAPEPEPPPTSPSPPASPPATPPAGTSAISLSRAIALTDDATGLMRQGNYAAALPLAQQALARLQGTGHAYEGYANYDVGKSLAELGRCGEALPYLERREKLLGPHPAVTAAKHACGA
ncbi:MAG: serine/threonine protein kinase [Actinomycetota bacterium]|nr:serine/threonine protein kinase [Actinomycetota bacterium]